MKPNRPAAPQNCFALDNLEKVIDRPDHPPIAAGKVLWCKHFPPPSQKLLAEFQLLGKEF